MRVLVLLIAVSCVAAGCRRESDVPEATYRESVVAFHTGVAALQTSQEVLARERFERVIALVPHEPAAWANLGLLLLRQQEMELAAERLQKAAALAPDSAHVQRLLALAAGRRGDLPAAIGHWTRALAIEPNDPKAAYAMAYDLERQGGDENGREAQRTLDALSARTGNLAVQIELARLAAKRRDAPGLERAIGTLAGHAAAWPDDIRMRFESVRQAARTNPRAAGQSIAFLKNVLLRVPEYRRSLSQVSTPREEVGEPIAQFLVLPNPPLQAAPADETLAFTVQARDALRIGDRGWAGAVSLTGEGAPVVVSLDGKTLRIGAQDGSQTATTMPAAGREHVLAADLNYDFRTDLVLTGTQGLTILRQTPEGRFADVTSASTLSAALLSAPAAGAWAADVDTDGDLDVVLAPTDGTPQVLRNNTDGTFTVTTPFAGVTRVRDFVWADLDGEGVPDAVFLQDAGRVRVFLNQRGGSFREHALQADFPKAMAIATAEVTGDAVMDLLMYTSPAPANGALVSLSYRETGERWARREIARAITVQDGLPVGQARLLVADLDNNGASDLVMSGGSSASIVLLGAADGTLRGLNSYVALDARAAADVNGDGRLELIGITDGQVGVASSTGQKRYHWQTLRPRAATATGDQRINSFGIGGEVEVRTGLHVQTLPISSPIVHVGLGDATQAEVTRLLWPNGTLQSEFNLGSNTTIAASQRLKGSCPWLFAWNGQEMGFVTDVLWRSPLGLRINAQVTADVLMTEDRVKVRGDQLVPRDSVYDLRITAELWETHFFDHVSLMVVDHPEGTEVWQDERFATPPPSNDLVVTGPMQRLAVARDDQGRDVSSIVAERDDRHLDFAGRGAYQGVTRDHFVEMELPDDAPRDGPLWLIGQGWIHPTDSSVNVAISQGGHAPPRGIALQVADSAGRFRTVVPNVGFPAGKDKTILIDVTAVFPARGPRRVRLATNMEIFWDRLGWAVGRPDVALRPARMPPRSAELRYRGYSVAEQQAHSAPERPRYVLEGTAPRWLDLEGYHTRFGDVRELLLQVDDRYVIMNAGDELCLQFPEAPPVAPGMVRDFVMISDGWEKDGDYNTTFSRTVLPLPTHAHARYDRAPGRLEDDPVYIAHPEDFAEYHTRYVTPDRVRHALRQPSGTNRQ